MLSGLRCVSQRCFFVCGCRGYFSIGSQAKVDDKGHYPDTYLSIGGGKWSKGVAFINGFNLVNYPAQYTP